MDRGRMKLAAAPNRKKRISSSFFSIMEDFFDRVQSNSRLPNRGGKYVNSTSAEFEERGEAERLNRKS